MKQREVIIEMAKNGRDVEEIERHLHFMFGQQAYTKKTIYKWMALVKIGKEDAPKEKPGPKPDEQLIVRISEILESNHFASTRQIADELKEPPAKVWRYLTTEMGRIYKHSRWLPHSLTELQKCHRVVITKSLLNVLESSQLQGWCDIVTGDQSWFKLQYGQNGAWLLPDDDSPEMDGSKISIEKVMVTIIWGINGFHIIDMMPKGNKYNSEYFIENILTPLFNMKQQIWSQTTKRKLWLHLDNSQVLNSSACNEKYDQFGFKRVPHPPYSPDIAPSDFFLFGFIKDKLRGKKFTSPDDLLEAITEILGQISKEDRKRVFSCWIDRCKAVIEHKGSY